MSANRADVSTYRWSRAALLRVLGTGAIGLAGLWLFVAVLTASSGAGALVGGIAAALTAAALAASCWLLMRPPRVLELSATGYRTWHLRGGGVPSADWSEVESVETRGEGDRAVIVVELAGRRTSIVSMPLLHPRAGEAEREMHERLNAAFGYRSLRDAADWSASSTDG